MTVGLAATTLANSWLNTVRGGGAGTSFTAPAVVAVKLHLGDPGVAGATNPSTNVTRVALTFAAAAAGSMAASNAPQWAAWANGNETISHISVWDSTTAGNFLYSVALTASKSITNGDTLNLTSLTFALTPIAA